MTVAAEKVLQDALHLNDQDRELVFEALAASLLAPSAEVDAAWIAEASRRMKDYLEGREASFDADEVFRDLERDA
jgi:hypothetical protein